MAKEKKKPFAILKNSNQTQAAFALLGSKPFKDIPQETLNTLEGYVCKLYGKPNLKDIDKARLECFIKTYGCTSEKNPLLFKKKINAQNFPPCKSVLLQKFRRTNQIAAIWTNATKVTPTFYDPLNNGWIQKENKFDILWFDGPQTPIQLGDILHKSDLTNESDDDADADAILVESSDDEDDFLEL